MDNIKKNRWKQFIQAAVASRCILVRLIFRNRGIYSCCIFETHISFVEHENVWPLITRNFGNETDWRHKYSRVSSLKCIDTLARKIIDSKTLYVITFVLFSIQIRLIEVEILRFQISFNSDPIRRRRCLQHKALPWQKGFNMAD